MKKILTASILVLMAAGAAFAQNENANPRAFEASMAHFRANAKAYGLVDADRELKQKRGFTDQLGQTHVRFDQFVDGVRVFEGEAISHVDAKGRVTVTSSLRKDLKINTTPAISEATAVSIAMARMNAVGGYDSPTATLTVLPAGERSAATRLTWHVRAFVENDSAHPSQHDFFVDAHTGEIAFSFDSLETAKPGSGGGTTAVVPATATGRTMWSGDVTLNVNHPTTTSWTMQDTGRGVGTAASGLGNYTLNMANSTRGGSIVSSSTSTFGDGNRTNTNVATAAADAHYGLQKTWDYFGEVLGRNGIDGNGSKTYSRVHYSRSYENAFWSDSCFCMTYGDGASTFYPLVSIDVAGHEMTHGVTSRTAGLTYSGESGGLNESTSDIFGTAVEFYSGSASDTPDWWIGERIWRSNWSTGSFVQARALRYMDDPAKDGRSPACWSSTLGSLDVHYSSGPANHMFYLLANGGTSKCNSSNVGGGIGLDKAAKIWFRALDVYMTSSTNFAAARAAALNAASDLYGASSAEGAAVASAFSGINVN